MNKMDYNKETKENLIQYKKDVLKVFEKGINGNDGLKRPYEHVLPARLKNQNIIGNYREQFFNSEYAEIDYHECFHHLNSSQALCINMFYPLIAESRLNLISELLNVSKDDIINHVFEYESDLEKSESRQTHFDFYFETEQMQRVYVELKYTEQSFGSAGNDQRHRNKFKHTFLPLLVDNPFIRDEYKEMLPFFKNYQILRNLVHIRNDSIVVFLYPRANKKIHEQALMAMDQMVTDRGKRHFKLLSLEDTLEHIKGSLRSGKLKSHFMEFEKKYLSSFITS